MVLEGGWKAVCEVPREMQKLGGNGSIIPPKQILWIICQAYHGTYLDMFIRQETRPEIPWKSMLLRRKVVNLQALVPDPIQDAKDS